MEPYISSTWSERFANYCIVAEAIAWSERVNRTTIYAHGLTADEAEAKRTGGLREPKLIPNRWKTRWGRRATPQEHRRG